MEENKNTCRPGCSSCCAHEDDKKHSLKNIGIAACLFVAALVADHLSVAAVTGISDQTVRLFAIIVYLAAYLLCGLEVVQNAVKNVFRGVSTLFDEQFLMTIASLGAVCIGEYPEAVAVMLFYQIGEYFQDYAVDRSRASISALMDIRPDKAFVIRNGATVEVDPATVGIGEAISVRPGERVPLDGFVADGSSFVDTSALTGESVPREVFAGSEVLAGFINTRGILTITVSRSAADSAVSRILALTETAAASKAKSEKFITRFSRIYTPAVCAAALIVALVPPLLFQASWHTWVYRAIIFLVVSCPCALVISVPLSFFSGIGAASRKGILVKGSNYLELLGRAQTAVFDKTGTLTKGVFLVSAIHPAAASGISPEELIAIATHAEFYSNHPISKSLKQVHHDTCCSTVHVGNTEELSGRGIRVTLDGKVILAGTYQLMADSGVSGFTACPENDTGTIVHIAVNGVYAGHIVISDEIKDDAVQAVQVLKKLGIKKTVMLTGDTESSAGKIAAALGIDCFYAQLLPADKVSRVEELLEKKEGPLVFVGDGINDAPVLARADVGIAMGGMGSDAAVESADVVIMDDKPSRLADAIVIARRTVRIVRQNIIFALGVKIAVMILGAAGAANMWAAVFADVGVTFLAVLNALRLSIRSDAAR